jgi:hypothetical protein
MIDDANVSRLLFFGDAATYVRPVRHVNVEVIDFSVAPYRRGLCKRDTAAAGSYAVTLPGRSPHPLFQISARNATRTAFHNVT